MLEQLLPVLCMSAIGSVPDDLKITFPPLWTPTAKETADIAKTKTEASVAAFQAGLIRADTAAKELRKLSDETGLFGDISDEEIAALAGKTYQDVTALRDPLAGLDFGDNTPPFEVAAQDALTLDYKGQPREKDGRFAFGKMGGGSTAPQKHGKIDATKMTAAEARRVSSGILTDHPNWKPGDRKAYEYGRYGYHILVKGPGDYVFLSRKKLK